MSLPLVAFAIALLLIMLVFTRVLGRDKLVREEDWSKLVRQLQPVPSAGIHAIADSYLHPRKNQIEVEPQAMLELLGGVKGIATIQENGRVMLALASYAIRWNAIEGAVVAEMIRRDELRLQRAVRQLHWALLRRKVGVSAPFHLQEIAASYHLMTARLLALYETCHVARYHALLEAV